MSPGRSLLRRTAAPLRAASLTVSRTVDHGRERLWEWRASGHLPSPGEMTAMLRRNGLDTYSVYIEGQRQGAYGQRNFLPSDRHTFTDSIRTDHPAEAAHAVRIADDALAGRLDLLGSGPVDIRRRGHRSGARVDWRKDPLTGQRYDRDFSNWRWSPTGMQPGDADVKGPWELTRSQHLVSVGTAYWLTDDERYARYFAEWVDDFIRRNPVPLGVHWACTMDVALRVVGWLTALPFFQGSPSLTRRWWSRFCRSLAAHGRFIAANLEFGTLEGRIVTSNHYLADVVGLYWLATNFPGLDAGSVWRGIAERALEHEVRHQFLPDGMDFESSLPYHRLATELLLSAYAMSLHFERPLSSAYRDALVQALNVARVVRQPSGRFPQIGDADDGRAHVFTGFAAGPQESMDHLLAAGARVLRCPDLAEELPASASVEALYWAVEDRDTIPLPPVRPVEVLPHAGLAILRGGDSHVVLANSPVGTRGFGNHKHNDQLTIEWSAGPQPLIVDAGSYTYTRDPKERNHFRGTAIHNTVMVDGEEQHELDPALLFRLFQRGTAELHVATQSAEVRGVEGWHTAYERLGTTHRRRLVVRPDGIVLAEDIFESSGEHRGRWHFLLHPSVDVAVTSTGAVFRGTAGTGTLAFPLPVTITAAAYSPGYNRRQNTSALVCETALPDRLVWCLAPDADIVVDLAAARDEIDRIFTTPAEATP